MNMNKLKLVDTSTTVWSGRSGDVAMVDVWASHYMSWSAYQHDSCPPHYVREVEPDEWLEALFENELWYAESSAPKPGSPCAHYLELY